MAANLERQRHIVDFTVASLLRRKGKNGALLAVYTLIVFLLASVILFTHALKQEAARVLKDGPEIIVQRTLIRELPRLLKPPAPLCGRLTFARRCRRGHRFLRRGAGEAPGALPLRLRHLRRPYPAARKAVWSGDRCKAMA